MALKQAVVDCAAAAAIAGSMLASAALMQAQLVPFKKAVPRGAHYIPSHKFMKLASFGFDKAAADLFWLDSIQYFHDEMFAKGRLAVRAPLYSKMAGLVTDLDPDFKDAYYAAGVFLSLVGRLNESEEILDKARRKHPETYFFPFELGTLLYLDPRRDESEAEFEARKLRGVERFKEALGCKDCPAFEAEFMRKVLLSKGQTSAVFELLKRKFDNEKDPMLRKHWLSKLEQTLAEGWESGIRLAVMDHRRAFGGFPLDLGVLPAAPGLPRLKRAGRNGRWQAYMSGTGGPPPLEEFRDAFFYDPSTGEAASAYLVNLSDRLKKAAVDEAQAVFAIRTGRRAGTLEELYKVAGLRSVGAPLLGRYVLDSEGRLAVAGDGAADNGNR